MAADGDGADVPQEVTAGRDAYNAGRDMNFNVALAPEIHPVERKLAQVVLQQAQEARSVLIGTDRPGSETANVEYAPMPGRLREADGRDIGDLRSILEYYRSLSPPRLVIIGAPGAGKTVLLLELQIRLLMERDKDPNTEVPVLISASACDTTKKWEDWLAAHLSLRFSIPERTAADLIAAHRILPIVDGLDEMDPTNQTIYPERAQALVRSLNKSMQFLDRAPVVVTSRPDEYARLTEGIDKARHVELSPLTGREAADHLDSQFRTHAESDRWQPVLRTLKADRDCPLATELSTPWRLTLALATFRTEGDPAQLLPSADIPDSEYPEHVDNMLLSSYVSSIVSLREESILYTDPKVHRWLTSLADGLALQARQGRSATDITLHEWWNLRENRISQTPYAILTMLPALIYIGMSILPLGLLAICAVSTSDIFLPRRRKVSQQPRFVTRLKFALATGVTAGATAGLTTGLATWFMYGSPAAWLQLGLMYTLIFGLAAGITTTISYGITNGLIQGFTAGIIAALGYGFSGWIGYSIKFGSIAFGFIYGIAIGLVAGLMAGLLTGLTNFSPKVRRPTAIVHANGISGLAGVLTGGLPGMLIFGLDNGFATDFTYRWLLKELPHALSVVPLCGLTLGLAISGRVWIRYHVVVAWNALRGRGPLRFAKFLDWAVGAGLLRESGVSYQFRHRQLQDWFTG